MYRPTEMAVLVHSRAYNGVVAVSGARVIGHIGFTRPTRASTVVEAGTTVVDPSFRGMGLMGRLGLALAEMLASKGTVGFIHFPTTAHPVMQRASLSAGGRETGVMLAYLPGETRDHATGAVGEGRLAVTVVYQPVLKGPPQSIYIPCRYRELILDLAAGLGLSRSAALPLEPPIGETKLKHVFDASRGLERISVNRIGADIVTEVTSATGTHAATLVHVDLPMDDPAIDYAVAQLRGSSFAFAAWLPGWADHDVLRLQYVAAPSGAELSPILYSPKAEALMAMIHAELVDPE
jgi:hypothetical protein